MLETLNEAKQTLLYIWSTSTSHKSNASSKKDRSSGAGGGKDTRVGSKKTGSKPNTRQMNQVASSAKKPQVQNSSGQPAAAKGLRMCQTCGVPHGLVLDCPAFRTLAPNCRANFANSLAACTSCLSTYQMANPVVTVANLKVIDMTARFQLPGSKDHEILVGSMLYTDQKVKLHFQKIPCR